MSAYTQASGGSVLGDAMMNNVYDFDLVGNVDAISNSANPVGPLSMGGAFNQSFTYDEHNRLNTANGSWDGTPIDAEFLEADNNAAYTLNMQYGDMHRILQKIQTHTRNNAAVQANQYNNVYDYMTPDLPNAVSSITDGMTNNVQTFTYDANGNMLDHINGNVEKSLSWDEDNRLKAINLSDATMQHYVYGYTGERVLKSKGTYFAAGQMGNMSAEGWNLGNYTLYVNPYVVIGREEIGLL